VLLLTGSTGFVGNALIHRFAELGDRKIRTCTRKLDALFPAGIDCFPIQSVSADTDWGNGLRDVEVVVHTIARVHVMNDKSSDPFAAFRETNVDATLNLARQAARAGVKRFVFVSSVKVNGESTSVKPFTSFDIPAPLDPYGISKNEAEQGLLALSNDTGLEVVIVRPPLVYGPGVRANFLRLMMLIKMGVPLPFGAVHNRRSMVALDNLVDLLVTCTRHPAAAGQVFMVSDECDVSTPELLHMIARAMNKKPLLLPLPTGLIACAAALVGKSAVANRLLDSLQVDIAHTKSTLGWQPIISMQESINKTVEYFFKYQR
jgi:nucleoside-diphosphate-sugar epimerase